MREHVEQVDQYEAPELRVLGSVKELTLADAAGPFTDAAFPDETAASDITFS